MAAWVDSLNGVSVAYLIGAINALMSLLFAFGVQIDADQRSAIVGFVNAAIVATAHLSHRVATNGARKLDQAREEP